MRVTMPMPAWVEYEAPREPDREASPPGYSVSLARSLDEIGAALRRADRLDAATAFQHRMWLETWFATAGRHADVEPLIATVRDETRGELAMVLPLVELRDKGRSIVEFADLGVTDYNAPLLGPAAPRSAEGARLLWKALIRALPTVDAIRLTKMPGVIKSLPNPLALLPASRRSHQHGHVLDMTSYQEFREARGRFHRKEIDRSWRVFQRLGGTQFHRAADVEEALGVLNCLEMQQRQRIEGLGLAYRLDAPHLAEFYRKLVTDGLPGGYVVVTALRAGDEIIAAVLGIRAGASFTILRICNCGDRWAPCSPGRLVIIRTMEQLAGEGCTSFDFATGDYEFKRRLGARRGDLFELTLATSWLGVPLVAKAALKGQMLRYPKLASKLRQLLQRDASGTGLMMAQP